MKITINEIANAARVAKSTVSKALNGQKGVSEKKREEILELVKRLKYEPNASAQALASSKTGTIGLLVPHEAGYSLSGFFWSAIINSIAEEANRRRYSLLILTPPDEESLMEPVESVIRRRNVDGLLIGAERVDPLVMNRLVKEGIPFVCIGRNPLVERCSVDVDNAGGSERIVSHLVAKGRSRIACITGPEEYLYNRERVSGYHTALDAVGIPWRAVLHSNYDVASVKATVGRLYSEHPDLDALFLTAGGDFLLDCVDGLRALAPNPNGIALAAFDDFRFFDYFDVPVCTVRQPLHEIGKLAASLLFDILAGNKPKENEHILPVDLILRGA